MGDNIIELTGEGRWRPHRHNDSDDDASTFCDEAVAVDSLELPRRSRLATRDSSEDPCSIDTRWDAAAASITAPETIQVFPHEVAITLVDHDSSIPPSLYRLPDELSDWAVSFDPTSQAPLHPDNAASRGDTYVEVDDMGSFSCMNGQFHFDTVIDDLVYHPFEHGEYHDDGYQNYEEHLDNDDYHDAQDNDDRYVYYTSDSFTTKIDKHTLTRGQDKFFDARQQRPQRKIGMDRKTVQYLSPDQDVSWRQALTLRIDWDNLKPVKLSEGQADEFLEGFTYKELLGFDPDEDGGNDTYVYVNPSRNSNSLDS